MTAAAGQLLHSSEAAQRAAKQILAQSRFHQTGLPHPLHGVLVRVGHLIEAPLTAVQSLVAKLGAVFPGGVAGVWAVFAALVLVAGAVGARRLTRRGPQAAGRAPALASQSAAGLERLAVAAQDAGHLEEAVRLRFRAGLTRLSERDAIAGAPTRPTVEISRALESPRFDRLAQRFDEIAYGSSPATLDDVDEQRRDWPQIVHAGAAGRSGGGTP